MGIRELFSSSGDDATRIRCKKTKEGLLCKLKTRDGQIATAEAIVDRDGQIALSDFEGTPSAVDELRRKMVELSRVQRIKLKEKSGEF